VVLKETDLEKTERSRNSVSIVFSACYSSRLDHQGNRDIIDQINVRKVTCETDIKTVG
jgi:hypothetical protein